MSLQENTFTLETPDGFTLYGVENWVGEDKPEKTVILCHGLGGDYDRALMYNGAHYFAGQGYRSVRFNFYDYREGARKQYHSGIEQNKIDLKVVFEAFQADKMYAAGHSYGGLALVAANLPFQALALWDPSHGYGSHEMSPWFADAPDVGDFYTMTGSGKTLFEAKFVEERNRYDLEKCNALASEMASPTLICSAENGVLKETNRAYLEHLPHAELAAFAAGHNFAEKKVMDDVFLASQKWFERF